MAFAFDTLSYSLRIRAAGVPAEQADALAEAARDFVMSEIVTKTDLDLRLSLLEQRLTLKLGAIMVAGVGALALLLKLT